MKRRIVTSIAVAIGVLGTACEDAERGVPWDFERMIVQPRYEAYGRSAFFTDGRAMRVPPEGTVPVEREAARLEDPGPEPGRALLARGRDRFDVYCAACHGRSGTSDTPVAEVMALRPPPSLLEDRIRRLDAAGIHRVILQGYGLMPSYAGMLGARDAWAVAYYVKALQMSQAVPLDALPPPIRERARGALATERR